MWARSIWIGLFAAFAVSAGSVATATPYCPGIRLDDGMSIDVIRLVVDGSKREIISAQSRLGGTISVKAFFDVTDGKLTSPDRLRLSIYDRALPPHGSDQPRLFATLRLDGVPPWRAEINQALPQGYILDEFTIETGRRPQYASAFMGASAADISVVNVSGLAVLTQRVALPTQDDWAALRKDVEMTMVMVKAKTCDVSTATVGPDLEFKGPPPLIIHGPSLPSTPH